MREKTSVLSDKERYRLSCDALASKQFKEAVTHLEVLVDHLPDEASLWFNLGSAQLELDNRVEALDAYQMAAKLDPNMPDAFFNCGVLLAESNIEMAIGCYLKCIGICEHADALYNLAILYIRLHEFDKACIALERAKDCGERLDHIEFLLNSLSGQMSDKAPEGFVRDLFDEYAHKFDEHLNTLGYQTPFALAELYHEYVHDSNPSVLDLGCGTGLLAEELKLRDSKLVGVDLSSNMLDKARSKGLYSQLHCMDIIEYLTSTAEQFDAILAADVLVYFGDLARLFDACCRRLKTYGKLAFSIELSEKMPYTLHEGARFSHHLAYVKNQLRMSGFQSIYTKDIILRYQNKKPVKGLIVSCCRETI